MNQHEFYQTKAWKKQSKYIWTKQHCLCAKCGRAVYVDGLSPFIPKEKRLLGAVHHKEHLNSYNLSNESITLNEDNLIGLCYDCHAKEHKKQITRDGLMFDEMGNLVKTPHMS